MNFNQRRLKVSGSISLLIYLVVFSCTFVQSEENKCRPNLDSEGCKEFMKEPFVRKPSSIDFLMFFNKKNKVVEVSNVTVDFDNPNDKFSFSDDDERLKIEITYETNDPSIVDGVHFYDNILIADTSTGIIMSRNEKNKIKNKKIFPDNDDRMINGRKIQWMAVHREYLMIGDSNEKDIVMEMDRCGRVLPRNWKEKYDAIRAANTNVSEHEFASLFFHKDFEKWFVVVKGIVKPGAQKQEDKVTVCDEQIESCRVVSVKNALNDFEILRLKFLKKKDGSLSKIALIMVKDKDNKIVPKFYNLEDFIADTSNETASPIEIDLKDHIFSEVFVPV